MSVNRTNLYPHEAPSRTKVPDSLFKELYLAQRGAGSDRLPMVIFADGPRKLVMMALDDFSEYGRGLLEQQEEEMETRR